MSIFRRNQVARRRPDDRFDLILEPRLREVISSLLGELDEVLEAGPDDPSLRRLSPPAYLHDPEKDEEYRLLAGDELRTSRRAAIDAVRRSIERDVLDEDELWQWLQSLNALRLVVGTRLGIEDDDTPRNVDEDDPDAPLWSIYDFTTWLQHSVVDALGD
ncbi:hypothetical protein BH23ACT2_BH23ACT2_10940 [soil metagenome]